MGQAIPFTFVALPVLALTYWWVTVPLLILFPLLGLRIASRLGRDR
jgi:TRAP-type C4-dicarboxylate transport system permease small subunit